MTSYKLEWRFDSSQAAWVASPVTGGAEQSGNAVSLLGGQRREQVDDGADVLGEQCGGALRCRGVGDARRQPLCSPEGVPL